MPSSPTIGTNLWLQPVLAGAKAAAPKRAEARYEARRRQRETAARAITTLKRRINDDGSGTGFANNPIVLPAPFT
jgi:hypothetical protein